MSDDVHYIHENGRVYANATYFMPCIHGTDLSEQDRLFFQHQIFVHALRGRLTTTRPLPSTRRILDLGAGPGYWAVAMAQLYPHAEVVAVDIAEWDLDTTEASVGHAHVTWEIDDLDIWGVDPALQDLGDRLDQFDFFADVTNRISSSKPVTSPPAAATPAAATPAAADPCVLPEPGWHFSEPFDMIHLRNMKGVFAHWEEVYAEIHASLTPGGWIEIADYDAGRFPLSSSSSSSSTPFATSSTSPTPAEEPPLRAVRNLYNSMMEASFKAARPLGLFYMHPSYLSDAGFVDVQTTHVNCPVGMWSDDPAQRAIGKLMLVVVLEGLEANTLRLLTSVGDRERVWSAEEVRREVEVAKEEIRDWAARSERGEVDGLMLQFKWVTARKKR
jgi:SAM-dependent methyltransferase